MDAYMKTVQNKLNKLKFVNDDDRTIDPNLRMLIANALKLHLEEAEADLTQGSKKGVSIQHLFSRESLLRLRQEFLAVLREKKSGLTLEQFKAALIKALRIQLSSERVEDLFFKVDVMKTEIVTWEAYSNYLLLEMDQKEKLLIMEKELLGDNIQFIKTEGRDSIKSLLIMPSGDFDAAESKGMGISDADSRYFTCSRDGVMNFWSFNFQTNDTYFLHSFIARGTILSYWVTAVEFIPDARILIIATTNFNLYLFHHGNNKEFELISKIEKFPSTIVCLSYHKEEPPHNTSFLTWGDEYGGVGVVAFHVNPGKTAIGMNSKNNLNKKNQIQEFHFTDLSNDHIAGLEARYVPSIHFRYVCQVRYVPKLHSWLTCSKDTCTALYIGDLVPNVPAKNRIYYSVLHGVTVFEYCEKMNFVLTGGSDMLIRIWNPLSKSHKLVGVLRGHVSPITHMMLDHRDTYLVSVGETKDILIFDLVDQSCIQKIKQHKLKQLGKKPVTAACINKKSHTVVMASNMRLAVIEGKEDSNAKRALTTNNYPITEVLYNPLFKQIVTGDWKSQVMVWNANTGTKMVHYTAHTVREKGKWMEVDIKVMSFDATYRRLITGHRDGMVKIWNYNVGVLLEELPVPGGFEVTSICCPPGKIFVAGCSNLVFLHVEKRHLKDYIALRPPHPDNITQLAVLPKTYLASASADGTLIIYSLKTHFPLFKFNIANLSASASVDFYRTFINETELQQEGPFVERTGINSSRKLMRLMTSSQRKNLARSPNLRRQKSFYSSQNGLYYTYCVEALVFLPTRDLTPDTAALLACMHNGKVLAWSMSLYGRCLGEFVAAHTENEMLHAADVTRDDAFLVTGDSLGFIKVWDISHYLNPSVGKCSEQLDQERASVWESFPYVRMRRDIKKFVEMCPTANLPMHMKLKCALPMPGQEEAPHLINSFKSHCGSIVNIKLVDINDKCMIISAASDMSVRLWSLNGLFIAVLGQKIMWTNPDTVFGALPRGKKEMAVLASIGSKHDTKPCENKINTYAPEWRRDIDELDKNDEYVKTYMELCSDISVANEKFPPLGTMLERVTIPEVRETPILREIKAIESVHKSEDTATQFSVTSLNMHTKVSDSKSLLFNRFGERMNDFLDYMKRKNIPKADIPADLKRTGSYTTLFVLETEMNTRFTSRWTKIRHATVWIVNFFMTRKLKSGSNRFTLENADATKVAVYSNNIKDMIEEYISSISPSSKETPDKAETMTHRTELEKKNYLMRPLTPLSSEIFGRFYSRHYTCHRPIVPWKVSEDKSEKVCPHKHLALATFPTSDPASSIKEIFQGLGFRTRHDRSTIEVSTIHTQSRTVQGFQPFTESEMVLVMDLNKTGWSLMADGTLVRKKVPLNSSKVNSYLPPLLINEIQVRDGVKNKGERCFTRKHRKQTFLR